MNSPSWATESPKAPAAAAATTTASAASPAASPAAGEETNVKKTCIGIFFLVINLGLCVLMAYTGAMGIALAKSVDDTANVFVGIYMNLFAAILFTYECIQICPCVALDDVYKKNFGFLYGTVTKSLYMFFIAILSFGLTNPADFAVGTGAAFVCWSVIQFAISWYFPDYFDKKVKYVPH